ncbi:recombinase family protein [Mucilaginibacter sp. JRF]|uniref:recombinase family protein n=1 Tax=Mucilaginibacter sp. JRF TaxID=2780088 RepID=UPI001880CE74|nr:recombinase family protein [Mucilaginibacter sp. JRF]MBE9584621.1 recombinase family protein [Mucilaginibacter sp. JRF]
MKIKYDRVSTLQQSGNRFALDNEIYDKKFFDTISGSVPFKERLEAKELVKLVESGLIKELVTEEFSRLGRNTGDVINVLSWLDEKGVNVKIKNLGIESRPNGKTNPIWKLISATMSSLYELELENIKERTRAGRIVYVQKGGKLGRPKGATESEKEFLEKDSSKRIIKELKKGKPVRDISSILSVSTRTIMKVKKLI